MIARVAVALLALAALTVLSLSTMASAGSAPAGADPRHLLVVPDTPEGKEALVRSPSARTVASYASFKLVEARGGDVTRLVAAGGSLRDDMREVRIGRTSSDPATERASLLDKSGAAMQTAVDGGDGMAVVQYVGPIKDDWTAAVRKTGVEVVTYMAQNGQLVTGDKAALARLAELLTTAPFVRAVTPYTPDDKTLPGLASRGRAGVVVSTVAGKTGAAARERVRQLSSARADDVVAGSFHNLHVSIDAGRIGALAELAGVIAIEPAVEPELLDERAAMIVANKLNASFQPVLGTGYRTFLQNQGFLPSGAVTVDITDGGVDKGVVPVPAGSHDDFYESGNPANSSRIVYAHEATAADADARDCGGHGTNVASIAAGFNSQTGAADEDAQGFNYGLGVAPFSRIGATKIFNCAGSFDVTTSITALHSAAFGSGARISNNSWGANVGGAYTTASQEFDALVRDVQPGTAGRQAFTEVVSAGNAGFGGNTIGAPGTAKNAITVGASESVRAMGATDGCGVTDAEADSARDIIDFSSRGPTDDGRIKPDIVAPGTHLAGAQPQVGADYNGSVTCNPQFPAGSLKYSEASGTSQAAPEVTGLAALLHDWYRRKMGGGTTFPSPAMTKALLVNTATDIVGGADGAGGTNGPVPTQTQGWGRINFGKVIDGTVRQAVDQTHVIGATGGSRTFFHDIASSARPLRVTLVWTDAPGPTAGNSFVNDLDLEVTAVGGIYKGNVLSAGSSVTGGAFDTRNNVENVFLPAGATGAIKIRVIARNIVGDGVPGNADTTDQDYALLVSNAGPAQANRAVFTPTTRTITSTTDGDAFIEPGEAFSLVQGIRNSGNVAANSIAGTLTGNHLTNANATWPNLGANATGNSTPFNSSLLASHNCGISIPVNVAITSSSGNGQVSWLQPVGSPAPTYVTRPATDVPKAIPDNNGAGVTSVLTATATGGTVHDIDVTIGQITHPFVGDLLIELTSPQGVTVRLFNRHGSSGDNLVNTVFNDSAATPIGSGAPPYTGGFKPFQPLSAFVGQRIQGQWKLKVVDLAADDVGTLQSWNTKTKGYACN